MQTRQEVVKVSCYRANDTTDINKTDITIPRPCFQQHKKTEIRCSLLEADVGTEKDNDGYSML